MSIATHIDATLLVHDEFDNFTSGDYQMDLETKTENNDTWNMVQTQLASNAHATQNLQEKIDTFQRQTWDGMQKLWNMIVKNSSRK